MNFLKTAVVFACLIVINAIVNNVAQEVKWESIPIRGTLIDFETGFLDAQVVTSVLGADGNVVTFGVGVDPLNQTCAYIGKFGLPKTAYNPNDARPPNSTGDYFLSDEIQGPQKMLNYFLSFKEEVYDFAIDLIDYRPHSGGPAVGDSASVIIYSDNFQTVISEKMFCIPPATSDPNVYRFNLAGFGKVKSAAIISGVLDGGTAIDNISYNNTVVTVTIIVEQIFTISEDAVTGTHIGNIKLITSDSSAVTLKIINNITEFEINPTTPFEITLANGANLDASVKNSYLLTIVATTGSGVNAIYDTSNIVINIVEITEIVDNSTIVNTVICPVVEGNNLVINGLTDGMYSLEIVNTKGQEVLKIEHKSKTKIDIATIPPGLYFTVLTVGNKIIFNKIHIVGHNFR